MFQVYGSDSLSDLKEIAAEASGWSIFRRSRPMEAIEQLLAFISYPRPVTFSPRFFRPDRLLEMVMCSDTDIFDPLPIKLTGRRIAVKIFPQKLKLPPEC
jgi:hypothetical protein